MFHSFKSYQPPFLIFLRWATLVDIDLTAKPINIRIEKGGLKFGDNSPMLYHPIYSLDI
jgi:hypothetical protein